MAMATKSPEIGNVPGESCRLGGKYCDGVHFGKKILMTLVGVLIVYLVFFVGTLIQNNIKKYAYIGRADAQERTITVSGLGKVTGNNDIAMTSLGYSNVDLDVGKAQAANKKVMDGIMADLKKLGVADKDWQTDYSIYPEYNYTQEKGQELKGYRVTNNVTVKIRDLSKISDVLNLAGKYGATQVSGLNFTIDDPENLKQEARAKALADAGLKAGKLALSLGVKLVEVVAYYESDGGADYPQPMMLKAEGMGGAGAAPAVVASGSRDVSMNVSVTFKIVPAY